MLDDLHSSVRLNTRDHGVLDALSVLDAAHGVRLHLARVFETVLEGDQYGESVGELFDATFLVFLQLFRESVAYLAMVFLFMLCHDDAVLTSVDDALACVREVLENALVILRAHVRHLGRLRFGFLGVAHFGGHKFKINYTKS